MAAFFPIITKRSAPMLTRRDALKLAAGLAAAAGVPSTLTLAALRVEAAHLTPEQIDFLAAGLIAALAARLAEYSTTEGDGRGDLL